MDINDQTEATVDVKMTKEESTFKDDVILTVRETNIESTLDVLSNIEENYTLKDDDMANGCNDIPIRKKEDILNGVVNKVAVIPISNDEDIANEEEIQTSVVNEESVAAGVASEEDTLACVTNEESNLSSVSNEKGIINKAANKIVDSKTDNSVSMDLEKKKYEASKQNSVNMEFDLDANHTIYRSGNVNEVTSDTESDSTTSLSSSSSSEDEASKQPIVKEKIPEEEKNIEKPKVKGELGIEDLPTIEELKITVDQNVELICVGLISTILDSLVVIQSLESESSPLNDDSILFLEDRTSLGQVFEIFGPVRCPLYSVRFNSSKDIGEKGLKVGLKIYYAPKEIKYTNYVFVHDLMKQKGSDASWEHDLEPPEKFLDYSDDEKERKMKKNKKKSQFDNSESDTDAKKDGKNQARRKRDSNNPFYLKNKSPVIQKNKNYKKKYESVNHQGHQNEPEFNPQQSNSWHSNAYTSWPPNGSRNRPFETSNNRFPNAFDNRPPNPNNWVRHPSNNWSTNPSNSWSTNPPNQLPLNSENNWVQTGTNNWVPNPPNNWPSTNVPHNWPTHISNSWSQNTPNNWSQNTPNNWPQNSPNNWVQNIPNNWSSNTSNNWSPNNPNSSVQNTSNSSTHNISNNWSEINQSSWTQDNANSWSQNTPNIPTQNTPKGPSQINPNVWPSNWPNNWPPNPNNPPPNLFSIPPPNILNSPSSNSTSNPSTNLPNNPALNAPSWTQDSQLSYPQTKEFPLSSNQWPPQHTNTNNDWNHKPNFNSFTQEGYQSTSSAVSYEHLKQ